MTDATAFFYEHAGWSYDPATQTPEQGRQATAARLAEAEAWAASEGLTAQWQEDADADEPGQWGCVLRDPDAQWIDSLWGIEFESGAPWGEPYARVVAAELAAAVVR